MHEEERAKIETLARKQVLQLEESAAALKTLRSLGDAGESGKGPKKRQRVLEDSEPPVPLQDDEDMGSEDEEDSEEDSSSTSSEEEEELQPVKKKKGSRAGKGLDEAKCLQKRANKLQKKAKQKDRKQQEQRKKIHREQQLAERNRKAVQQKVRALAGKVKAKVAPHKEGLEEIVQHLNFPSLPKIAQAKCHQYLEELQCFESDARSTLDDPSATSSPLNLEAVVEACKASSVVRSSVSALLKTVSKF